MDPSPSGTLVKNGSLSQICEAQTSRNKSRDPEDFSLFQIVLPSRKRKFNADSAILKAELVHVNKKSRIQEFHAHKLAQLREEAMKDQERYQKHLIAAITKRKREVAKLITRKYQVLGCDNRQGKWVVKLKRTVEYSMSPEKIREILNQDFEVPPLPPERKHHVRKTRPSRSRKRTGFIKVNGSMKNVQTFHWGLTSSEIREDLKRLNLYKNGMDIEETSGFLNNATVTKRLQKRRQAKQDILQL